MINFEVLLFVLVGIILSIIILAGIYMITKIFQGWYLLLRRNNKNKN